MGGQLEGIAFSEHLGRGCAASSTDGLWARLRGGAKRVVLILAGGAAEPLDSASGLLWPPVVEAGEESRRSWRRLRPFSTGCLFQRAKEAGLDLEAIGAVTSDGAHGLVGYLREALAWVHHQRCVWHLWRNLARELARQASRVVDMAKPAAAGLVAEGAARRAGRRCGSAAKQVRRELVALTRADQCLYSRGAACPDGLSRGRTELSTGGSLPG